MSPEEQKNAQALKEEADRLFEEREVELAYEAYSEAAIIFASLKNHAKAAEAYARAALCEKVRTGFEPLVAAAINSEKAAIEALRAKDYENARRHYRDAGLLFEREGNFDKYSICFSQAQDAYIKFLWSLILTGKKHQQGDNAPKNVVWTERLSSILQVVLGILSKLCWGYGEKPVRALITGSAVIVISALCYYFSGSIVFMNGHQQSVSLAEAFYFSGVTFTTLGYGDFYPLGWPRMIVVFESLAGLGLMPLFLIALTRKYLRVYR